jgi:hypothetical protein
MKTYQITMAGDLMGHSEVKASNLHTAIKKSLVPTGHVHNGVLDLDKGARTVVITVVRL